LNHAEAENYYSEEGIGGKAVSTGCKALQTDKASRCNAEAKALKISRCSTRIWPQY
jgi:hypothetical protein